MTERRFLVAGADLDAAQGIGWVRGQEHHHLARVLRLRPGDAVATFDGAGGGHRAVVDRIDGDATRLRITGPDDAPVEPAFHLTLAQAIPHHEKMEWIIQKATELGVAGIVPIQADRIVVKPRAGRWERLERWRRVALEAARQCGRRRVPHVADPVPLGALAGAFPADAGLPRIILLERAAGEDTLRLPGGAPGALVVVGPEGGWTADEERLAREAGMTPAHMGPRILRAETAAIVAVTLMMYLAGELEGTGHGSGIPHGS